MAKAAGVTVRVLPVDLGGKVFPISGGLPLPKRAPQRQAYRLVELKRYSEFLKIPLHPQPKYFPVGGDDAACLIIAVDLHDGPDAAMKLTGAVLSAVWSQERNIGDDQVLAELLAENGLDAKRLVQSESQEVRERYEAYTQQAIAAGVFGAPSYVIDGEIFWGQDRLDFVARKLGLSL
jgi:2-hydroxychromene-2-carboxylate isomerase